MKKRILEKKVRKKDKICCGGCSNNKMTSGCVYGLGFIGALVYYISTATGFWTGVLGVLKASVWPAFLVHGLLKFIGI